MLLSSLLWGQYSGTGTFNKIIAIDDLTDGYYVIAESNDEYAMNNTHNGTFLDRTAITPAAGSLTDPSVSIVWYIETNGGGKSIYNEEIDKFVSYTGSSNNIQIVDAVTTDNQRWTITYDSDVFTVSNLAITARMLQYNAGSPRFAAYTSNQRKFNLYKLEDVGGPTPPSISNITQTPATDIASSTTVSVSAYVVQGDAAIDIVELHWNTTNDFGTFTTIAMAINAGDTYTTAADIPAQADGTTVFYRIYAEDVDAESRTSAVQSYTVNDPATTTLPYAETFDTDLGDTYTYSVSGDTKEWIASNGVAQMNGFNSGDLEEDWLILPGMNLDDYGDVTMNFESWRRFGTSDDDNYLKLLYSTNYAGVGNPTAPSGLSFRSKRRQQNRFGHLRAISTCRLLSVPRSGLLLNIITLPVTM